MIQSQFAKRKKKKKETERCERLHACMFIWGCTLLKGEGKFTQTWEKHNQEEYSLVFFEILE